MVRVGASMGQRRLAHAGWPLRHRRPRDGAPICAVGWLGATKRWSQKLGCFSFRPEPGGHGRNKACIQASFFSNAFHGKLEEHASAGVRYALDLARYKNQIQYKLVEKLDVGFGQFFDFGEEAGYGPTSYFVSAEGFFYVLCYRAADVAQRKFEGTPRWILQAG